MLKNGCPMGNLIQKLFLNPDKYVHLVVECCQFHLVIRPNLTCPEKMTERELILGEVTTILSVRMKSLINVWLICWTAHAVKVWWKSQSHKMLLNVLKFSRIVVPNIQTRFYRDIQTSCFKFHFRYEWLDPSIKKVRNNFSVKAHKFKLNTFTVIVMCPASWGYW